ncbi:cupin domain-containing protein [Carnimonas bestiolae]|uniref:cupin domain-containing protein n=1 Tax=Carnimonas bestiolae TaxID=3402172 RepID=UPI003EDC7C63
MANMKRRSFVSAGLFSSMAVAAGAFARTVPEPISSKGVGGDDPGPRDMKLDRDNPTLMNPPSTDAGTLPNLRFSFSDAHMRQSSGGWTRQVTQRELPVSTTIAGVDMRLNAGAIRELHWHKEAEWAFVTYGNARITVMDVDGGYFVDDLEAGDLWYFPPGIPHSIQGIGNDGVEFLLAFDDGSFDENSTFLLSDWFKHIPREVLAKNFGIDPAHFDHLPEPRNEYIFAGHEPPALSHDLPAHGRKSSTRFSHRMLQQAPLKQPGGSVRITDSSNFKISKQIAAALVELEPGGLRELHWHPNNDEWQYYLSGTGRMGVFGANGMARTFDVHSGDVGYVPFAMGHYIENTGNETLRFLELFKSDHYADISLKQWLAMTPPDLVKQHLHLDDTFMQALTPQKTPVVAPKG